MARRSRIIQTEDRNKTVESGKQHVDGDDNGAGCDISLLLLNDKGIHPEVLLLNFYRPGGSVPVAEEIVTGRAQVGGRGSYGGNLGWNPQGELDLTGITETTAESGVHEEDLVTTLSLPTNTNKDIRVEGA